MITIARLFLFLLVLSISNPGIAAQYPAVDVPMNLIKVGEHSYYVQGAAGIATDNAGFISNAGVVITPKGVVLIDALGSPSLADKLLKKIRDISELPILAVLMTHYHADHIYGLQVFKEQGAEIIAPRGTYEYLDAPSAMERLEERRFSLDPWVNEKTYLVKPDRLIEKSQVIALGGMDFQLDYLGSAHSTGDLAVYVKADKVLYSGDIIFEGRIPFVGDADTKTWLDSLRQLQQSDLKVLIPGHGGMAKNPSRVIALNRDYLEFLLQAMGSAVEEMQEFAQAYAATDWSAYEKIPAFAAANRRNAYQVFLALEKAMLNPD